MDLTIEKFDLSLIDIQRTEEFVESAKSMPMPKALFGEFWLEGELAILFADTGKGKSALAVQIAESIARGKAIEPFKLEAKPQKVLYLDFELTRKQFEMRYAADAKTGEDTLRNHYKFSKRFYRAEIRRNRELPEGYRTLEHYVRAALEPAVTKCGTKVLIIDNLTYLRGPNDTARESLPLMRELARLKETLGLSILVIAHTSKRNAARRLTVNDLQGSKALSNFADSIFAIGQSEIDAGIRYLKQLKARSTDIVYDSGYVPAFELAKRDGNFLAFIFRAFGEEMRHIASKTNEIKMERAKVIAAMSGEGMSQRAIASELGISAASVNRYLHLATRQSTQQEEESYNVNFYEQGDEDEPEIEEKPVDKARNEAVMEEMRRDTDNYLRKIGIERPWLETEEEVEFEYEEEEEVLPNGVELDATGRMRRRTAYGWDYCVESLE